ncbi:hypothetical protein LCGC14_2454880, partial [marine sediment metagenome]
LYLREYLLRLYEGIKGLEITEDLVIERINNLSETMTDEFRGILHNERFRIGVSQKLINLFLKYLWVLNLINEPPYCPFDSIVKRNLTNNNLVDWTKLDNTEDYMKFVDAAKEVAAPLSIAVWELETWNRNVIL